MKQFSVKDPSVDSIECCQSPVRANVFKSNESAVQTFVDEKEKNSIKIDSTLKIKEIIKEKTYKNSFLKFYFEDKFNATYFGFIFLCVFGFFCYLLMLRLISNVEMINMNILKESMNKRFSSQDNYKGLNNELLISEKLIPMGWKVFLNNNIARISGLVVVSSSENNKQYQITYTGVFPPNCKRVIMESALSYESIQLNKITVKDSQTALVEKNVTALCDFTQNNEITLTSNPKL